MFDQNKFVFDGLKALVNSDTNRGYITRWAMSAYSSGTLSTEDMAELQKLLDIRDGVYVEPEPVEEPVFESPTEEIPVFEFPTGEELPAQQVVEENSL